MTGKQLRNSILQWAIQGKLVPQDPNDEPASVLLERIREEKARLAKEKKIKKDKNESIIYRGEDNSYYEKILATGEIKCINNEIPFEIPESWAWCRLGIISTYSQTKKKINASKADPMLWGLDLEDIEKGGRLLKTRTVGERKAIGDKTIFRSGDILYSKLRPYLLKILIALEDGICTPEIIPFTCYGNINKYYIVDFLKSPYVNDYINSVTFGVKMPRVSTDTMTSLLVPLPPLYEQERIEIKLSKLIPLIERFNMANEYLNTLDKELSDSLLKGILQEAIQGKLVPQLTSEGTAEELLEEIKAKKIRLVEEGKLKASVLKSESRIFKGEDNKYHQNINGEDIIIDDILPFAIPSTWSWVRLGDLFEHNTGKALNGKGKGDLLRKYLTTSNLYWDYFDFTKVKEMYFTLAEIDKCTITKGDLLICEGGDVGRAAIWNYDFDMCIQNHIHRLRSYLHVHTRFFYYVFRFYKYIGLIGGKGIGIQGLSSNTLHNIVVPLPPLKEQERITSRLDYIVTSIMSR